MRWLPALLLALLSSSAGAATVALVIDDLGHNRDLARRALALPPPVTAAVLPESPYAGLIARSAARTGIEVLVHLPMQGESDVLPATWLRTAMPEERFRSDVRAALERVPGAIGLNNHMGSVLTADRRAMRLLMTELGSASRPLVFLDSRTTPDSVAEAMAAEAGLGTASRDVFLDNDLDPEAIERQFGHWLHQAHATGCALAIGHPHVETLATLERLLPHLDGVHRVGLREYIELCGIPASAPPPGPAQVAAHSDGSDPAADCDCE